MGAGDRAPSGCGPRRAGRAPPPRAPRSGAAGRWSRTGRRRRGTGPPSPRGRDPRWRERRRTGARAGPPRRRRGRRGARRDARQRCAGAGACGGLPPSSSPAGRPTGPRERPLLALDAQCPHREPHIAQAGPVAPGTRLRSGRPHRSRLATPSLGCHCDRSAVTHGPFSPGRPGSRRVRVPGRQDPANPGTPLVWDDAWHNAIISARRARVRGSRIAVERSRIRGQAGAPKTGEPPTAEHAPGRSCLVTYVDRTMTCVDCGVEFIHSAADQEYYAAEGVHLRPQALCIVPGLPAVHARRRRRRRPLHRRSAGLRAHRRPRPERVLRRGLHVVRQPGAGAVQAAHGQARLLLGLLPPGQARLSRAGAGRCLRPSARLQAPRHSPVNGRRIAGRGTQASEPERVALAEALPVAPAPDGDAPRPWTCHAPLRPTTAVSSSIPRTTEPLGRLERHHRRERLRPRVVVGQHRDPVDEGEPGPPADREGQRHPDLGQEPEVHRPAHDRHRARGAPDDDRAACVRPWPAPRPAATRRSTRAGGRDGRRRGRRGPPRRSPGAPRRRGPSATLRTRTGSTSAPSAVKCSTPISAQVRKVDSPSGADAVGRITTRGRGRPVASSSPRSNSTMGARNSPAPTSATGPGIGRSIDQVRRDGRGRARLPHCRRTPR